MINHWRSSLATKILWSGGVIAYPTEAVWGLGCLPENLDGVERILALKDRPMSEGVILVAADVSQFSDYLHGLDQEQWDRLDGTWPGPVTWLVEHHGVAPDWIAGKHQTVALRVSDHPVVRQLCMACESPLVSTSANPTGRPPARSSLQVRKYFGDSLDMIYPGALGSSERVSEIRDLASNRVAREG